MITIGLLLTEDFMSTLYRWLMTYPGAVVLRETDPLDDDFWHVTIACADKGEAARVREAMGASGLASEWHSRSGGSAAHTAGRRKADTEAQRFIDMKANAIFVPACALDDMLTEWLDDHGGSVFASSAGWVFDFPDEATQMLFKLQFGIGSRTVTVPQRA
jgi:hypothetical protein